MYVACGTSNAWSYAFFSPSVSLDLIIHFYGHGNEIHRFEMSSLSTIFLPLIILDIQFHWNLYIIYKSKMYYLILEVTHWLWANKCLPYIGISPRNANRLRVASRISFIIYSVYFNISPSHNPPHGVTPFYLQVIFFIWISSLWSFFRPHQLFSFLKCIGCFISVRT